MQISLAFRSSTARQSKLTRSCLGPCGNNWHRTTLLGRKGYDHHSSGQTKTLCAGRPPTHVSNRNTRMCRPTRCKHIQDPEPPFHQPVHSQQQALSGHEYPYRLADLFLYDAYLEAAESACSTNCIFLGHYRLSPGNQHSQRLSELQLPQTFAIHIGLGASGARPSPTAKR